MRRLQQTAAGLAFVGSVDAAADVEAAGAIAHLCPGFSLDDDDECYVDESSPNCFNCRARRWTADGFSCMRGLLKI